MRKLFICYYSGDRSEVSVLAEELRIRGIDVWIDYDHGFRAGDATPSEARRALKEDCFGLLFYATPGAFGRDFIMKVELDKAIRMKERNPDFLLMALPRKMNFAALTKLSREQVGIDLGLFHSHPIIAHDTGISEASALRPQFAIVANMILCKTSHMAKAVASDKGFIGIHFNTREREPSMDGNVLNIDWAGVLGSHRRLSADVWRDLLDALRDIKKCISQELGRPRIRLSGRRHLSAAFAFGRVFPAASGFKLEVQQGDSWWSTACAPADDDPLKLQSCDGAVDSDSLFVEITATEKPVREAVRRYEKDSEIRPFLYLRFEPQSGPRLGAVTNNSVCCAMAMQVRKAIADAIANHPINEIHLFGPTRLWHFMLQQQVGPV